LPVFWIAETLQPVGGAGHWRQSRATQEEARGEAPPPAGRPRGIRSRFSFGVRQEIFFADVPGAEQAADPCAETVGVREM
jgi:hypothetical protein